VSLIADSADAGAAVGGHNRLAATFVAGAMGGGAVPRHHRSLTGEEGE
jgi:hypothetical protein